MSPTRQLPTTSDSDEVRRVHDLARKLLHHSRMLDIAGWRAAAEDCRSASDHLIGMGNLMHRLEVYKLRHAEADR